MAQAPVGVLLAQVGSPEAPTTAAVRRYLAQFLSDRRVVDLPRLLWWPILHGIILRTRPRRSAALYRKIWTPEGSPLVVTTRRLAAEVERRLHDRGAPHVRVVAGMGYGEPSLPAGLRDLGRMGCGRVLVLPLFPQYASATTASVFDGVAATYRAARAVPALRFVRDYHDNPAYVAALAASVRAAWAARGRAGRLLVSFHGLPRRYEREGDPYPAQCRATASALVEELALSPAEWSLCFQSRFGREPWLQPYTDEVLRSLPGEGVRDVEVICPGFSVDCLETLEEIAITNREWFEKAGGGRFHYIPALNDAAAHADVLAGVVEREAQGWL